MKGPSADAINALREALTGSAIRAIAGIVDVGEAFLARIKSLDDEAIVEHTDDKDAWVPVVDELTGMPSTHRLFIPGNILFAKPHEEDTVMVVRPRDLNGVGVAYVLHGDAGTADRVPGWFFDDTPKDGLYTPRTLRLESKSEEVEIVVNESNKKVTIIAGLSKISVQKDAKIQIDAGSADVEITGGVVKVNNGSTKVAKVGTKTTNHDHSGSGMTAGPYPVSGNTQQTQPVILDDGASADLKVP